MYINTHTTKVINSTGQETGWVKLSWSKPSTGVERNISTVLYLQVLCTSLAPGNWIHVFQKQFKTASPPGASGPSRLHCQTPASPSAPLSARRLHAPHPNFRRRATPQHSSWSWSDCIFLSSNSWFVGFTDLDLCWRVIYFFRFLFNAYNYIYDFLVFVLYLLVKLIQSSPSPIKFPSSFLSLKSDLGIPS